MKSDKSFLRNIEKRVEATIKKFMLIDKRDRILVAVSGGKDSTTALYILKKLGYKTEAITVDVAIGKYTEKNLENIRAFCSKEGRRLHEISFRQEFGYSLCYIHSALKQKGMDMNSCAVCGTLRRYVINRRSRELKATKVVLGHNMDDEAQNILMNFFKNRLELSARLGPMTGITKHPSFVPRVKPLYFVSDAETERYSRIMGFPVEYGACPCSIDAFRRNVKGLLDNYEAGNPGTKKSIIKYFLSILPILKEEYATDKPQILCSMCGEPSKSDICRTCSLLERVVS